MPYHCLELSYSPPSHALFEKILNYPYPVFLQSDPKGLNYQQNRWDIFSASPAAIIERQLSPTNDCYTTESLCHEITALLTQYTSNHKSNKTPFISGVIGIISYGAGEQLMRIQTQPSAANHSTPKPQWPDLLLGIYQWAVISDHLTKKRWLVADNKLNQAQWLDYCHLFNASAPTSSKTRRIKHRNELDLAFSLTSNWQGSFNSASYNSAFDKLKSYIANGDCYQSNLTQQFSAKYSGHHWHATQKAWKASPAPFSGYIKNYSSAVSSCSPECFIQIENGSVITKPIKGTRPRGITITQDVSHARELCKSVKDKAENLMIVDLMRNDLGRYCQTGSVKTPKLFDIESFTNVHHLVSTVTAKIEPNNAKASLALFLGSLPGGSITGAPKKRAMEIIAELEPHHRTAYCGSLFYLSANGNLNSNILIRSLLFESDKTDNHKGTVYCWGGGGIVADSDAKTEHAEAQIKVQNILDALSATASPSK